MPKPTETRLGEIAEVLKKIETEVESWDDSDFMWLIRRLEEGAMESKFMVAMKFHSKAAKGGSLDEEIVPNLTSQGVRT